MIGVTGNLKRISIKGRYLFLPMDHGIEHGPTDFTKESVDPDYVIKIARHGKVTGVAITKGVAEKYFEPYAGRIPLILKVNSRTNIVPYDDAYSAINCSVKKALQLGASAIGYTLYVGSPMEAKMTEEFGRLQEEAHDYGLPVIMWAYPRGRYVKDKADPKLTNYASRVALELGADIVKLVYPGSKEALSKCVISSGRTDVVVGGGKPKTEKDVLDLAKTIMDSGAKGLAFGRNFYNAKDPKDFAKRLSRIVFG
jgi:class I fructose-bisphosphate aldolase